MELLINLLQNQAVMGALAVVVAWVIIKYVIPKLLESPTTKERIRLIVSKFDELFTWVDENAEKLGISKYQKLAKLMDLIAAELSKQIGGSEILTPSEQAMVAKLAAEKAKK